MNKKPLITLEDFGVGKREALLSNGARLVVLKRDGMPISIRVLFRSGSRFDPPEKEGLAHFVEHLIVAGSKRFPAKDKLAAYIEQLGGVFGAFTGPEVLGVDVEVGDPSDFSQAVTVLHEILCEPLFERGTIETEREAILREIGDKKSNPERYILEVWRKLFFQGTEVGRSNLGTEQTVKSITRADLLKFYREMLVSGRMVIVISGDMNLDAALEGIDKNLPVSATGKVVFDDEPLEVNRNQKVMIASYQGLDQAHMILGFRTCSAFGDDAVALDIIRTILGGGRASVLARRLRYEKGLVYGVGASSFGMSDAGAWAVKTSTAKGEVQKVLDIIAEEFDRVSSGNLTGEELQFAKDKIVKSTRRLTQTSASWVRAHAFGELVRPEEYLPLDRYLNRVTETTAEDLQKAGRRYFVKGQWFLGMCGDVAEESVSVNF